MININSSFLVQAADGHKIDILKREILRTIVNRGELSITDISKEVNLSVPTVTKFLGELIEHGFLTDYGYENQPSSRRAMLYGLRSGAGYFVGVDITHQDLKLAIMDFNGTIITVEVEPFAIGNDEASIDNICARIKKFIAKNKLKNESIISVGVSLTGRIDSAAGYSYSFYYFDERPLADMMSEKLGINVYIENDSRAMAYGEYLRGEGKGEDTMIFINLSWGFGVGMIIGGKLFYGKSGFSGEYGHIPMVDNEILCQCGKRGCLETAVSGLAARRMIIERLEQGSVSTLSPIYKENGDIGLQNIIEAVQSEDMLAIEVIEIIGQALGKAVSGLINIFNPETVVLGGNMSVIKDYLMLPMRSGVNKYSLRLVSRDTTIKASQLGPNAAFIGACMLVRSKILGLI
ncbi:MAG: ROK family transcriptional regulator [Mucinivorans sp.]